MTEIHRYVGFLVVAIFTALAHVNSLEDHAAYRANMPFDTPFTHLHRIPECPTLRGQIGCGCIQHACNESSFIELSLANVHC